MVMDDKALREAVARAIDACDPDRIDHALCLRQADAAIATMFERLQIEALQAHVEALEADLVEWKNQHENLLSVRQQDIAAMQAKIDALEKELAFKNEAIRLTKGCPGKIVVRGGFYKIDCYKKKHARQALAGE